jgi:alkyl hydroperoxide reductase subunit AhpF
MVEHVKPLMTYSRLMADSGSPSELEARLASLPHPVRLVFFTQTFWCDTCLSALQVVDQLASLSSQITVDQYNLVLDKETVAEYDVDRAPAIAVVGDTDLGIRYYGVPLGYEVASLVDAVVLVGRRELGLSEKSLTAIAALDRPVDIKVFITPT